MSIKVRIMSIKDRKVQNVKNQFIFRKYYGVF